MPSDHLSTRDIHEYLNHQSKLSDSRIEDAYMRLSKRYGEARPSSPTKAGQTERRTLSSSLNLPIRKHITIDHITRPTSAHGCRTNDSTGRQRGILKKTQSSARFGSRESPDQWFQRIMHAKQLSPLDLCELFSYGDARKHPKVPLSYVCGVLFDLDPESANGADPVTDEMEDFLYQFATDEGGKIMVNIKEGLRALDIWQSRVLSASANVNPLKSSSDPQSKAVILESKNRKLKGVISSLQDANLRLSRQLDSAKLTLSPQKPSDESTPPAWSPRSRTALKPSTFEFSPVKFNSTSSTKATASSSSAKLQIVNLHEQELIEIASKLQFSGVKHLEELLKEDDAESTGYVNLKQLCSFLADRFQLIISETRLIEVCLGMNFNSSAQLDYKELVDVLLDILIYALPDIRASAKRKSLVALDKYLQSGFPPEREGPRQLLDALCSKYDVNGDQCISVGDLIRVFHKDLVKHHALELPFPLEEQETIQLAHPFLQRNEKENSDAGFVSYPELLDAILGPFPLDFNPGTSKALKRALKWEFWRSIYMALCGGDSRTEEKVLSQLSKILTKVDPKQTYTISTRHFQRIFERHFAPDDMEVMVEALAMPEDFAEESDRDPPSRFLRYDVMLKLIFGTLELNDEHFFDTHVRRNLLREQKRLQSYASELMAADGAQKLTIQDFYETFILQAEVYPISICSLLFLFSSVDSCHDGTVGAKSLNKFLSKRCWASKAGKERDNDGADSTDTTPSSKSFESIKKLVAESCAAYDFRRVLDNLSGKTNGWVSSVDLLKELTKMLREQGVDSVQQDELTRFVRSLISSNTTKARIRDAVHCDAFFDILFDWDAFIRSLRLPHSLLEITKVFEAFDWEHIGSIRWEDWNKAYRSICREQQGLADWEVRVLQRRFPDHSKERERDSSIDFARLLVYLLAYQQEQERKRLQTRVMEHFQQKFATKHSHMSSAETERLFRALDTDNKGHFDASDLKAYLTKEMGDIPVFNSSDALEAVMNLLACEKVDNSNLPDPSSSSGSPTVVTLHRFLTFGSSFSAAKASSSSVSKSKRLVSENPGSTSQQTQRVESDEGDRSTISSLRELEITILEIASTFADRKGNILPTRAFRYLSDGPTPPASTTTRNYRSNSPLRRSTSNSPTSRLSVPNRNQQRVLEASPLDPLTPTKLKQLLQIHHDVEVSTHLISQFFLHIGSPSKYFLDLVHFSQWAAPLSVELQVKVRAVVRQMLVKGKGGGGKLDLDRFLAQLQRRIQDSPQYMARSENLPLQHVSMLLLLSKLHQLNVLLHKQELMALFRHFGMEGDLEAVDYTLFLQRLYEINASIPRNS